MGILMIDKPKTPELVNLCIEIQYLILKIVKATNWKNKTSDVLTDVLRIAKNHHVKLEGDFVHIVIPVLLLEGIGRQMGPNMNLLKSSLPSLRKLELRKLVKERLRAQQPNYNNISPGLNLDSRSVCRSLNSRITDPTTNIEVPPNLLNQLPTSFPSNISQLRGLTAQNLNNLLNFYGLPTTGRMDTKQGRLAEFIGISLL
ncbi:7051_t:CDS:2 [Entrophospora sp. SA101]|nr:7051_t:CDS:2 [Entrophospora sp. SA101]CAJ0841103.1 9646_t:CDS:2 [Entrophospora sp. SA101]